MLAEYEQAWERYGEALKLYEHIGARYSVANTFWPVSELCAVEGKWKEAIRWMEQSAQLYEEIGVAHWAGETRKKVEEWRQEGS